VPPESRESRNRFLRTTGAPSRFAFLTLDDLDREGNEETLQVVERLGDELSTGSVLDDLNLILLGSFGVGKTRLSVYLLRSAYEYLAPHASCHLDFPRFFRATDLAELRFGPSFGSAEDEEDRRAESRFALERSPFVVIDDVHRVAGYKGEEVFLESAIERRYDSRLSTVLTMNELPKENARFADFLRYFETIPLVGGSRRGK
jgi:DNA replication protein DnaC